MNTDIGKLVLRIGFAVMMLLLHGIPKVKNLLSDDPQFVSVFGMGVILSLVLAAIVETVFPILLILGYKARLAAIPLVVIMLVAIFDHHSQDPLAMKEKAILFLIGFVSIALIGAGKYSIDKR